MDDGTVHRAYTRLVRQRVYGIRRMTPEPPGSTGSTYGTNSPTCSPDPSSITPTTIFLSNYSDRTCASRQAAKAQNHIFDSLGERYGLRIIPGQNSFLVPPNISRSMAVGAIMHPGGPACSPRGRGFGVGENKYDSQSGTVSRVPWPLSDDDFVDQGGNWVSVSLVAYSSYTISDSRHHIYPASVPDASSLLSRFYSLTTTACYL